MDAESSPTGRTRRFCGKVTAQVGTVHLAAALDLCVSCPQLPVMTFNGLTASERGRTVGTGARVTGQTNARNRIISAIPLLDALITRPR